MLVVQMCVICLPPEKSSNRSIYGPVSVLLFGLECVCTSFPLVVVQCSWCLLQTVSPLSLCCRAADSVVMHVDLLCCVLSSPPPHSVHLYYLFPSLEEGGLATYRTAIVQNQHLAMLAKVWGTPEAFVWSWKSSSRVHTVLQLNESFLRVYWGNRVFWTILWWGFVCLFWSVTLVVFTSS